MEKREIEALAAEMTLEEKASLCSGADFWHTKAVERLGIPAVMMADGPHGLRKQTGRADHLGIGESVKAVCFPTGAALASSFDRELLEQVGEHLGDEAAAEGLHTVLGPAVNIKRGPLCGRNFEYFSEDPFLAGALGSAYTRGMQRQGVGVSVKHFAANNQETRRMSVNAEVSRRALREIYLAAFETVVREGKPWAVMCSYNQINGAYCCENPWLLDQVLRKEWGFDGVVMTDWGAMNHRVRALEAGLELEMPASGGETDRQLAEAVRAGALPGAVLDRAAERLLEWIFKGRAAGGGAAYDKAAHHGFARRAAAESAVLLKNTGILPLKKGSRTAFIGPFAAAPRYQGGGSSHVNSGEAISAVEAAAGLAEVAYADGTDVEAAVRVAAGAESAVIFAGLPESAESEGFDRESLELPAEQNALISAVAAVQPNTVVVLHNGAPVTMPWLGEAAAVLELYLGGEAVGEAAADLLFGDVNPSGKLAETFPLRLEDTPCYLDFPGEERTVRYGEDIFVGYRWYDARKLEVLFPFGYGLSYTTFAYTGLTLDRAELDGDMALTAQVTVKNTGARAGKEVVQLYVCPPRGDTRRPVKELKGFAKVELAPGEEKKVWLRLDRRSFAYYEEAAGDWYVPDGTYTIWAGGSSRDLPLAAEVTVRAGETIPLTVDDRTTVEEVLSRGPERGRELLLELLKKTSFSDPPQEKALGADTGKMLRSMADGLPLHTLIGFGDVSRAEIARLMAVLDGKGD